MADDFFDQLAGGTLRDRAPNGDAVTEPADRHEPAEDDQPPPSDPHGDHPLDSGAADPERDASTERVDPGRARAVRRRAPTNTAGVRRLLARTAAVAAIGLVLAALGAVVAGGDSRPATTAGSASHADRVRLRVAWLGHELTAPTLTTRWRSGGHATLTGRLTADGAPIRDALVSLLGANPARPQLASRAVGELRTDAHGRFQATVALDQGSARKKLTLVYLAHRDTSPAARAVATLAVRAPITVTARPIGRRGASRVRLHGTTAPAATLRLLVKAPGDRRWRRLATVLAGGEGGWSRVVALPARGTYRLLARVPADSGRGYGAGQSPALTVRVR